MTTCTICADQLSENLSALPCRHAFHHDCIQAWFRQKPSCPNCNATFHRNSIIGPLFLDDARLLQSSKLPTTNVDPPNNANHVALAQSNSKIAQLERENIELTQKVRYLKSLRTIIEAEGRMQNISTQVRVQHWREMNGEELAVLLEVSTRQTKDAEEKLLLAKRENEDLKTSVDEWKREKEFFESRYDRLRKTMKDAQKRKPRTRNNGIPSGSVVTGSSSKQASQTTVLDESDESTDDEHSAKRVVPKFRSSGDSSRKKNMLLPFGMPSNSNVPVKRSLSSNRSNERADTNGVVGAKRRRGEEEDNGSDGESTTDDGIGIQSDSNDSEDNGLNDIEIVTSRIER
ncbi:hypothetical protein BJV82DRAFT_587974 [Fennellomyces sp. T-0311]|nr:hypothetical protein BJV82DRAFT_587974 [Fennellomyces sp. T-0311]